MRWVKYQNREKVKSEKYPVLLTGDACYQSLESDTMKEAFKRGYVVAKFNRLELANDTKERKGPLFELYPEIEKNFEW